MILQWQLHEPCVCVCVCVCVSCSVMSDSLRPHGLQPARLLRPWNSPGNNTGVGCHFLLQGIFLTHGLNPDFPHCRQTNYCLSHQGIEPTISFIVVPDCKQLECPTTGDMWYIHTMEYCSARKGNELLIQATTW